MEVSRHFIFIFSRLKLVAMAVCNMHSLQLISQPFWDCNDCTDQPGVTGCILSCNLSRNVEKEIHCKLQKTCYTLQARAGTCNGSEKIHAIVVFQTMLPF